MNFFFNKIFTMFFFKLVFVFTGKKYNVLLISIELFME